MWKVKSLLTYKYNGMLVLWIDSIWLGYSVNLKQNEETKIRSLEAQPT